MSCWGGSGRPRGRRSCRRGRGRRRWGGRGPARFLWSVGVLLQRRQAFCQAGHLVTLGEDQLLEVSQPFFRGCIFAQSGIAELEPGRSAPRAIAINGLQLATAVPAVHGVTSRCQRETGFLSVRTSRPQRRAPCPGAREPPMQARWARARNRNPP